MKKRLIIICIWLVSIALLHYFNVLSIDMKTIDALISENRNMAFFLFLALWIIRLLFLIPGTTLIILGGICFNPIDALFISTLGLLLSQTLIYIFAKSIMGSKVQQYVNRRYPDLNSLLESYNYKLLAIGIICPIVPADIICFLSASLGIKYSTYILTILIAHTPIRILYSLAGTNLGESTIGLVLVIISLILVTAISIKIWQTLKKRQQTQTGE